MFKNFEHQKRKNTLNLFSHFTIEAREVTNFAKGGNLITGANQSQISVEPQWDGGMKVSSHDHCHMTKMATMLICGKNNFKKLPPRNQQADDFLT